MIATAIQKLKAELGTMNAESIDFLLQRLRNEIQLREEKKRRDEEIIAHRMAERDRLDALPARYMHPSNRSLAWSGEGRRPEWVEIWLSQGGTLYALEIAAEKMAPRAIPDGFLPVRKF